MDTARLNEVTEQKLHEKLTRGAREADLFASQFQEMTRQLEDYLVPVGNIASGDRMNFDIDLENEGRIRAVYEDNDFNIHPFAFSKIASFYGLPSQYMNSLASGTIQKRELATHILNRHNEWQEPSRRMLRVVGNEIRGFVSDRYKRLNSNIMIMAFIEGMKKYGAKISGATLTDTRFYLEGIIPRIVWVDTPNNGRIGMLFGARLQSSDFGNGKLDVRAFAMQAICSNGMVRESLMSKVHLGARLPEGLLLSKDTYIKDSKALASALTDITKLVFDEAHIQETIQQIQLASGKQIDLENQFGWLKKQGMVKEEVVKLENIYQKNDPMDGMDGLSTLFKLNQAIGTVARDIGGEREKELNEIAGNVLLLAK